MHLSMTAKLIYNYLAVTDDIMLLSLFLPYLCLSSGGVQRTASATAAFRHVHALAVTHKHTHTHTHTVRAVQRCTYCIIFRKWLGGVRSKVLCVGKTFLPPSPLGDGRTDSWLPRLVHQKPLCYQKALIKNCYRIRSFTFKFELIYFRRGQCTLIKTST